MHTQKKILVIKHGSFGDLILATGAMKSISNFFPDHNIYILTESKYQEFISHAPFVKNILCDDREPISKLYKNFFLIKKIVDLNFEYIFDLQNSLRTSFYNGILRFFTSCKISSSKRFSHYRYHIPLQGTEHVITGLNNQLALTGIDKFSQPSVDWLNDENFSCDISNPFVILIPGTSPKGIKKRWMPENYALISKYLINNNYNVVVVGTEEDMVSASPIFKLCPETINLLGKSPPKILFNLAKRAKFIISNDTGPAILSALSNTTLLWIVNDNSVSKANIPIGNDVIKISSNSINDISVEKVKNVLIHKKLI